MTARSSATAAQLPTANDIRLINSEHQAAVEAHQGGLEHAMACGEMLKAAKEKVGHGNWATWLAEHCPDIAERTARRYMWMGARAEELEAAMKQNGQALADLSGAGATKLLAKPQSEETKAKRKRTTPTQQSPPAEEAEEVVSPPIDVQLESLDVDEVVPALREKWDYDQRKELIVSLLKDLTLSDVAEVLSSFPLTMLRDVVDRIEAARTLSPPKSAPTPLPPILKPEPQPLERRV
jgi:hypothetical protein